jgi:DNA-binding NarL/FixJ family response regulator
MTSTDVSPGLVAHLGQILATEHAEHLIPHILAAIGIEPSRLDINTDRRRHYGLTPREAQVLTWMSRGLTNTAIGEELYLTEQTVKTHARRLYRKLDVRDRAHAVAVAITRGLLTGGQR